MIGKLIVCAYPKPGRWSLVKRSSSYASHQTYDVATGVLKGKQSYPQSTNVSESTGDRGGHSLYSIQDEYQIFITTRREKKFLPLALWY